jgi:calcineurin-like phosphoesterase family protein
MALFWTSDLHCGHEKIIGFSKRPFKNADEMDTALIANFNSVVSKEDTTYILGDFAFYRDQEKTRAVIHALNGNKILVLGNHDRYLKPETLACFGSVHDYLEIVVPDDNAPRGKQMIVMLHYPMRRWNKSHFASWSLFGHTHGHLEDDPNSLSIDVGVDCHNYTPISYDQVKALMAKKTFVPIVRDR